MYDHAALFYADDGEFLAGTTAFISEGVAADEEIMVVVDQQKIGRLQHALGRDAQDVIFLDMTEVGINPARIIPAWRRFVDEHQARGRTVRGIGEPIWPERNPAELVECEHHEALLNIAFEGTDPWRLLCPYDTARLDPAVVARAQETHPLLTADGTMTSSDHFRCAEVGVLSDPLPAPPDGCVCFPIRLESLAELRRIVAHHARTLPFERGRADDLVLAVSEIAANSLEHGGGAGTLLVWPEGATLICQISDSGRIVDPLVGRRAPTVRQTGGRGIWVANQVCDLVQVRSSSDGTTVRLHMAAGHPGRN